MIWIAGGIRAVAVDAVVVGVATVEINTVGKRRSHQRSVGPAKGLRVTEVSASVKYILLVVVSHRIGGVVVRVGLIAPTVRRAEPG